MEYVRGFVTPKVLCGGDSGGPVFVGLLAVGITEGGSGDRYDCGTELRRYKWFTPVWQYQHKDLRVAKNTDF